MRYATTALLLGMLALPGAVAAQPVHPGERILILQPESTDTQPVWFLGRTGCSITAVTITLRKPAKQADASPSSILIAQSVSGCNVALQFKPDQGCGATGCRAGNFYQVDVQVTDGDSNKPIGSFLVGVKKEVLQVP